MPSTELLAGLLQATLAGSAAIVMVLANLNAAEAQSLLAQNNGFIRQALSNT